ncbi:hypothetical protein EXE49_06755 [Halorubrum sp. ASP121]|uniref:hypothetical protein n=1 Tax=Halorubrum sp. ASP121 TaxID=1855858 RepID=UPI0010F504A1|nr:hypothetical protein [Halorubrum sp. ASP121]TKX50294.1 hypothetical protein EXE49_06755 [Halorubrum sp. ASP121]
MTETQIPLTGRTLIVGSSGVGKTSLTARTLTNWLEDGRTQETVVFEFGPELGRTDRVVGRRLCRFVEIPDQVWINPVEANAPRSQGSETADVLKLARENAERANRRFNDAPSAPAAVFVNDATIGFQHEAGDLDKFIEYCSQADCVVVNAYEGDEFGRDDPVSRREQTVLRRLRSWTDRTIELS